MLLIKNVQWEWSNEQEESFQKIKQLMQSPPVLAYYDVNANVTLSVERKLEQPRSYIVKLSNGRHLRRNVRDMRHSRTKPCALDDDDPDSVLLPTKREEAQPSSIPEEGENRDIPEQVQPSTEEPVRTRSGREVRIRRDNDFEYY